MTDVRISDLPTAATPTDTDLTPLVQTNGGALETRRSSFAQLRKATLGAAFAPAADFGAKGDGTTNDTAAFNAMLASGKIATVPYSSAGYVLGGLVLNGQSLNLNGSRVIPAPGCDYAIQVTGYGAQLIGYGLFDDFTAGSVRQTTLAAAAAAGAGSISLASGTGIKANQRIAVELTSGSWHSTWVSAVAGSTVTLKDALPGAAASGRRVWASFGAVYVTNAQNSVIEVGFINAWGCLCLDAPASPSFIQDVTVRISRIAGARMFGLIKGRNAADCTMHVGYGGGGWTSTANATGNGSTTVFGLADDAFLQREVFVSVNGFSKTLGTDFSVTGPRSVTFTTPPPSGSAVSLTAYTYGIEGYVEDGRDTWAATGGNFTGGRFLQWRRGAHLKGAELYDLGGNGSLILDANSEDGLRLDGVKNIGKATSLFIGWAPTLINCINTSSGTYIHTIQTNRLPAGYQVGGAIGVVGRIDATSGLGLRQEGWTGDSTAISDWSGAGVPGNLYLRASNQYQEDGGSGYPALSWKNEPLSGLYRAGSGVFRYDVNGAAVLEVNAVGLRVGQGNAGTAAIAVGQGNTGLYQNAANNLSIAANGTEVARFTPAGAQLNGTPTATTPAAADNSTTIATTAFVKAQGYSSGAALPPPVTSVAGRIGAITLSVADVAGAAPVASPSFTGQVLLGDGSAAAPGLGFAAETGSGLYRGAAGVLHIRIQGGYAGSFSATGLALPGGTVTAPSLAFWPTNTGLFQNASNNLSIAANGLEVSRWTPGLVTLGLGGTGGAGVQYAGAQGDAAYLTATPTSGSTVTVPQNVTTVSLSPASLLASLTVKLPATPFSGQEFRLGSSQQITALTLQNSAGAAIAGAPGFLPAGGRMVLQYQGSAWVTLEGSGTAATLRSVQQLRRRVKHTISTRYDSPDLGTFGNTTKSTLLTLPGQVEWVRFAFTNQTAASYTISAAFSPSSQVGNGWSPYNAAGTADTTMFTAVTFNGAGADLAPEDNPGGSTATGTVPANTTAYYSDWMPASNLLARIDTVGAPMLLLLRTQAPTGTAAGYSLPTNGLLTDTANSGGVAANFSSNGALSTYTSSDFTANSFTHALEAQVYSRQGGYTLGYVGTSIMVGFTTTNNRSSFTRIAAKSFQDTYGIPIHPMWVRINTAGVPTTALYIPAAIARVKAYKPDFLLIQVANRNDAITAAQQDTNWRLVMQLVQCCFANGTQPILVTATPWPAAQAPTATEDGYRQINNNRARASGLPLLDYDALMTDGGSPARLLAAYNDSADGIHPGNTGHAAVAPVLVSLLANLIQP